MKKLLLTLSLAALSVLTSYGQGTVQFQNGTFTRFTLVDDATGGSLGNVPVGAALNFGLFWGTQSGTIGTSAVTPLGRIGTTAGVIVAALGNAYPIAGTDPGQRIYVQVRGWSDSFGNDWAAAQAAYNQKVAGTQFGQTEVVQLGTAGLGPSSGPGATIWQASTQTNPNLLKPLVVHIAAVPEPTTIALGVLGLGSLLLFRRRK